MGYATFAQLVARSSLVDAVVVAVTARRSAFLERDLQKLKELKKNIRKPVFMWTYTLPADRSVEILNEAGYPLFGTAIGCARTVRAMADFRAMHERMLRKKPAEIPAPHPGRAKVRAALTVGGTVMTEWHTRALRLRNWRQSALACPLGRRGRNGRQGRWPPGRSESPVGRHPA